MEIEEGDWKEKAQENIDKWGLQDKRQLVMAMTEELGELSQAVLEYECEDGDYDRIEQELNDLAPLMYQFQELLNNQADQSDDCETCGGLGDAYGLDCPDCNQDEPEPEDEEVDWDGHIEDLIDEKERLESELEDVKAELEHQKEQTKYEVKKHANTMKERDDLRERVEELEEALEAIREEAGPIEAQYTGHLYKIAEEILEEGGDE